MRDFHFKYLSRKKIYVGPVSQTGLAGIVVYDTIVIAMLTYKTGILNIESWASLKARLACPTCHSGGETDTTVLAMERVKKLVA